MSDLYRFNLSSLQWALLTDSSAPGGPGPRYGHGFVATSNGLLFVFGGCAASNGVQ